jgi:membrane protease YdiL (CAAX protease family)
MPDIAAEAVGFYNEVWDEGELDLASALAWGYVLGPLREDQVDAVKEAIGQQGFAAIEVVPQEEDPSRREVRFSEVGIHTPDSFAGRIRGLAELAQQHGCGVLDWSIEEEPGADGEPAGGNISFACHACGKSIVLPEERGGHVETCPHCDAFVDVPEQAAGAGTAAVPSRPAETERAKSPAAGSRTPAALWIEVLAVLCLAYFPWFFGGLAGLVAGDSTADSSVVGELSWIVRLIQVAAPLLLIMALSGEGWARFGIVRPKWITDVPLACLIWVSARMVRDFMVSCLPAWMLGSPAVIHTPRPASPQGAAAFLFLVAWCAAGAFAEELVMRGYLLVRLEQLLRSTWRAVVITALLFASYHLYQGITPAIIDVPLGIVYALWFCWCRRLWPLCAAHALHNILVCC